MIEPQLVTLTKSIPAGLSPGLRISANFTLTRKWWQIWKPRQWTESREMVVISGPSGSPGPYALHNVDGKEPG